MALGFGVGSPHFRRNVMHRSATFARLALVLAALAPALAMAQASPATQPAGRRPGYGYAYGPQRDTWYIGFGIGSGFGSANFGGTRVDYRDLNAPLSATPLALQFEVGATLRPDLLLGFDLRFLRTQSSGTLFFQDGTTVSDPAVQVTQALAMLTWFPMRYGLFFRGGAGLASYSEDAQVNGLHSNGNTTGVALLGGVGYAFWLGQRFNLTLNLDLSAQGYGDQSNGPNNTRQAELYLGFAWY
jgi:hypothetical protein